MTLQEIEELAGHRNVSPWIVKLVGDAVAKEREREWVGLIQEEIDEIIENAIDKVDALIQTMDKLKDKNT